MINLDEEIIPSKRFRRCRAATCQNDYKGVQQVVFQEELITEFPDGTAMRQDAGACGKKFVPGTSFPVLDPATGEPTGETATHDQLYALLFSVYRQTAAERKAYDDAQATAREAQAAANALIPAT